MDRKYIAKVRRLDRIASRVITVGGIAVIASVIAILILIVKVTIPLFVSPSAKEVHTLLLPAGSGAVLAVGIDNYMELAYVLNDSGTFSFIRLADRRVVAAISPEGSGSGKLQAVDMFRNQVYNLVWQDNSLTMVEVKFTPRFDKEGTRSIEPSLKTLGSLPAPAGVEIQKTMARRDEEGSLTRVDLLADQSLAVTRQVIETDLFDNETTENFTYTFKDMLPGPIQVLTMDEAGTTLYAGTGNGYLLNWRLGEEGAERLDTVQANREKRPVTALNPVFGDQSLAVGDEAGSYATWMPVRSAADGAIRKMTRIHQLAPHEGGLRTIINSRRNKTLYSLGDNGIIHADHVTTESHLLALEIPLELFAVSSRDNSLVGLGQDRNLHVWAIDNPHPETNFRTLFGKVWYEGYDKPEYVWQSSAQTDDSEPKLSITPLIFGTIKGTLYAMLFAVPLAIFGAVYTSQFTTPALKKNIKPVIEILASIPSVVIGFLIALWLAPIVESAIFAVFLSLLMLPVVFVLFMLIMQPLQTTESFKNRVKGYEFVILIVVIFLTGVLSQYLAAPIESMLFDGNFKLWLYNDLGMRYDQRNCIIIAFGLGICVIPIIFSITEDAISNIPPSLTAASLALGASRWQTVWRVILPSASPGIFAAIIIGFGRAVGETMVVLMATGNTPIMDWSIFNGMRTLSANIAVEVPEAPVGGTLYRVLFLCATILFMLTFVLNTGAEVIRERLRKKYGRY